ncbi:MAG TPA: hypothetical protein PLB00_04435 [Pseudomonadota bacterium]|nr:hypothetical protein [Pseudomonadota bacterium]
MRPHDLRLDPRDDGLDAVVQQVRRRADRHVLSVQVAGQDAPFDLDLPVHADAIVPAPGAQLQVGATRYRVFASA